MFARSVFQFRYSIRSGINLHDKMFGSVLDTSVRFFDVNPVGQLQLFLRWRKIVLSCLREISRVATRSEKARRNENKKRQKSANLTKFEKMSDFVSSNLQNFLISKAFKWYNINQKSFKVRLKLQSFPRNLQNYLISNAYIW